jgi:DNA repair photolyase
MPEKLIKGKMLLQKVKKGNSWFGYDYNMNLYRGCLHGCIYCDSRSDCYEVGDFEEVKIKINALEILEKELASKRTKGMIGMGSMSDPYNPYEKKYELTKKSLSLMEKASYGVFIITKSSLILRDIDVLKAINNKSKAIVGITITTSDDDLAKMIEPHVSSTSERFEALKVLNEAGIDAGVLLMPVLPFINDTLDNVKGILEKAHTSNAKFVYPWFGVTLRDSQREFFYEKLDKHFPGLKKKYEMRFGNNYACESPNVKLLYETLGDICKNKGILYKMEDINRLFVCKEDIMQISLFDEI